MYFHINAHNFSDITFQLQIVHTYICKVIVSDILYLARIFVLFIIHSHLFMAIATEVCVCIINFKFYTKYIYVLCIFALIIWKIFYVLLWFGTVFLLNRKIRLFQRQAFNHHCDLHQVWEQPSITILCVARYLWAHALNSEHAQRYLWY